MKKMIILLSICLSTHADIGYTLSRCGRFGDKIKVVIKALYLADKYKTPFIFTDSPYFKGLPITQHYTNHTPPANYLKNEKQLIPHQKNFINYYTKLLGGETFPEEINLMHQYALESNSFKKSLQKELKPTHISNIKIPSNRISIAIHIRRSGGAPNDLPVLHTKKQVKNGYADINNPTKFPPIEYYINCLTFLCDLYFEKPLYIHIFTDDPDPQNLVQRIQKHINHPDTIFGCRESGNAHNKNIIDDWYHIMHFDCLIRPDSSFTETAQLIGNHSTIMTPDSYQQHDKYTYFTSANIITINEKTLKKSIVYFPHPQKGTTLCA